MEAPHLFSTSGIQFSQLFISNVADKNLASVSREILDVNVKCENFTFGGGAKKLVKLAVLSRSD